MKLMQINIPRKNRDAVKQVAEHYFSRYDRGNGLKAIGRVSEHNAENLRFVYIYRFGSNSKIGEIECKTGGVTFIKKGKITGTNYDTTVKELFI